MRRRLTLVLACLLAISLSGLSGCISVTGTVKLTKSPSGAWEAVEVSVPTESITASGLRSLEDFFNGK